MSYLMRVFRATEEANRNLILSLTPPAARILDVGCGDGSFTHRVACKADATTVNGIEWDPPRAEAASARGIVVAAADLNENLPFETGSFDLVHGNQIIEHLTRTDRFLGEIYRVLGPSGKAIISTNNLGSWHNIICLILGVQPPPSHVSHEVIVGNRFDPLHKTAHATPGDAHLRIFSWSGLKEICEHHGFHVAMNGVGYYPFVGPPARLMTRIDPRHGAFLTALLSKQARAST